VGSFWDAQITLIEALQRIEWLAPLMRAFTLLGEETFFLLLVPLLYWCIDARLGVRVGLILLLSTSLNSALKLAGAMPRPYWYSSRVAALASEPSFGLPSAHAQNAVAVWGAIAAWRGRPWAWGVALLLALLIGASRVYLGVHFVADVLAGWALGALVLWAFLAWFDSVGRWVGRRATGRQIALALAASLLMLAPSGLFALALGAWQIPAAWARNAQLAAPGGALEPLGLDTPVASAGTWFGFGVGAAWLAAAGRFSAAGLLWKRAARYLVGMAVVVAIWAGLRALFPDDGSLLAYALRFLRYALVGAWIAAGAPAVFQRLGLSDIADAPLTAARP
jgi:membrane-associated phospholipid phosphatase